MSDLNLADLMAQFNAESESEEPPSPTTMQFPGEGRQPHGHQTSTSRSIAVPTGDAIVQEEDLLRMVGEATRNVQFESGLVGLVIRKLRGNELARSQYETMHRRMKAFNGREEARMTLLLAVSLQILGFKVAVSGAEEMERYLQRFDPNSAAGRLGKELLDHNMLALQQFSQEIGAQSRNRISRDLGFGR